MLDLFKRLKELLISLIEKGKAAEQLKAGKEWDSIVEELKKRK